MVSGVDWHWGVSNPGPRMLLIWLEPWADEFELAARSSLTMRVTNARSAPYPLEIDDGGEHIVVWANAGDRVEVRIDGVAQDSGSAIIEVPDAFGNSTKAFLNLVFANQPAARLGGQGADARLPVSLWQKLKRILRFPLK